MRLKKVCLSFVIAATFALCSYSPAYAQNSTHRVEANSTNRHTMFLRSGQRATINITGDGDTDLDIYVFDPSGTEVARDISTDDRETVSFTANRTGNYRVEIRNLGNVWNRYQMFRRATGSGGGGGGMGGGGGSIGGGRLSRRVEANGTNRHTMYASSGQRITVRLTGDGDTDLDLFVFDPSGNEVARDISTDDNESASFTAQRTGNYRVEVRNLGNVWNGYQIWRELGGGGGGGRTSHRVEANSTNRHSMYFRAGEYVVLRIDGDDDTDLDLFVFGPGGNELARDISTDDDETVSFTVRRTGYHRIEVRNLGNVWNAYQMWRQR